MYLDKLYNRLYSDNNQEGIDQLFSEVKAFAKTEGKLKKFWKKNKGAILGTMAALGGAGLGVYAGTKFHPVIKEYINKLGKSEEPKKPEIKTPDIPQLPENFTHPIYSRDEATKLREAKQLVSDKNYILKKEEQAELNPLKERRAQLQSQLTELRGKYWSYTPWNATPEQKEEHERLDREIEDLKVEISKLNDEIHRIEKDYFSKSVNLML